MLYYKKEEKLYNTRKELRSKLGWTEYERQLRRGNIVFINDDNFINQIKCQHLSVNQDYSCKQDEKIKTVMQNENNSCKQAS